MVVSSYLYFFGQNWVDGGVKNQGQLLSEPIALTSLSETIPGQGKWRILLMSEAVCIDQCATSAQRLDSLKILLGKDAPRVVPVAAADFSARQTPFMSNWLSVGIRPRDMQARLAQLGIQTPGNYYALLADPGGHIILFYPPDKIGSALLDDIKHLLRLSRIG